MQALKEIQKYQKGADLLIWRVPFQRLVREIVQRHREGFKVTELSGFGTTRSRGGIFGRVLRAGEYLCHPCKESNYHAERHTVSL